MWHEVDSSVEPPRYIKLWAATEKGVGIGEYFGNEVWYVETMDGIVLARTTGVTHWMKIDVPAVPVGPIEHTCDGYPFSDAARDCQACLGEAHGFIPTYKGQELV